jgi:hypothetical protein
VIKIAVSMVLVVSTLLAPVAAARERDDSIDESPENVVRAAYSLLSYDPDVPTDRGSFSEYFADDAVVSFGPSPEEVAVLRVDEFLDEVQERVQTGEFGGVGHTFDLEVVECWVVGDVAKCMVDYRFERPGEEDLVSTESVLLSRSDGRWLITSIGWLVQSLDEAESVPTIDASLLVVPTAARGVRPTPEQTWDRALPILGKKVVAKGFSLPKPYGVAFVGSWKRQDVDLSDLAVGVPGGEKTAIPFLDFNGAAAELPSTRPSSISGCSRSSTCSPLRDRSMARARSPSASSDPI